MQCDIIARGIIGAVKATKPAGAAGGAAGRHQCPPRAKKLIAESGLPVVTANDLTDAAVKVVGAAATAA